ncbi:hypothetical protein [Flavobacterium sp.]|uniref:hypothetical protein n=1 Tax=Flavobacterium sp. TaxID=239 RepID=UPI00286ACBCA|nr:hypothetical protein [Flavobacterium sp.]
MTDSVLHYFKAEKKDSIYAIFLGLFSVVLTICFLIKGHPFYNGMSYAFIAIGLIQLVAGTTVYLRSDMDIVSIDYFIHKDMNIIKEKEIPRMELIMKNFAVYRKAAIVCITLGLLLWLCCQPLTLGKGIGIGLTIQSTIMLILDYLAEQRGKVYLNFLQSLLNQES